MIPTRLLLGVCALGTTTFVSLLAMAMSRYSGGTWFNAHVRGHSFWRNFLCDLFHTHALDGADNTHVSQLARAATFAMLLALIAFFALVARLDPQRPRTAAVTRIAGTIACILAFAIPLTPSDTGRTAHLTAVLVACAPALAAVAAATVISVGQWRRAPWLALAAMLTLVAGGSDAIAYAYAFGVTNRWLLIDYTLPLFQRVAMLSLVLWIIAVCVEHVRRLRASSQHSSRDGS